VLANELRQAGLHEKIKTNAMEICDCVNDIMNAIYTKKGIKTNIVNYRLA
jgi:hypothetical protein